MLCAAKRYSPDTETIVVDDASTDGSAEYLGKNFPRAKVITLEKNVGFARACNIGIRTAANGIVVLLNTDVRVDEGFLEPLVSHFDDYEVFAVMAMSVGNGIDTHWGVAQIPLFKRGRIRFVNPNDIFSVLRRPEKEQGTTYSFYAIGGHCAIDRKKYLHLGGFDDLFYPFFWEDVDLCYRAWKRGWKTLFEPQSNVAHEHCHGTIRSVHGHDFRKMISERNHLLFIWKNITSTRYLYFRHIPFLIRRSIYRIFLLDFHYYRSLFGAFSRLGQARSKRKLEKRNHQKLSDEEIFDLTASWWKEAGIPRGTH